MPLNIEKIRSQFPALALEDDGVPRVYLDNPAGTQVPKQVLDRITNYMIRCNANHGGDFRTSVESDAILDEAHQAMADLLNAPSLNDIIFGANMTTLTFAMSRSIIRWFKPGDEIILSRMDHDANVAPWMQAAKDMDITVKWLPFNTESYQFDLNNLADLLSDKVRLVAVNYASNAIGTINDVKKITEMAHDAGALMYIDAVQYVPHSPTDVQDIGCDFLACSVYKFFGPHQGVLWGRSDLLEKLYAYRVRPAGAALPGKFETGTQSHEGQAGTLGALEYLAAVGETVADEYRDQLKGLSGRAGNLRAAMLAVKDYEKTLSWHLIKGLVEIPGVTVHGITDPDRMDERVPTVSFTKSGVSPETLSRALAAENIYVWHGDYYAVEVIDHLGLTESGGMLRVGAAHYNTTAEIDKLLDVVAEMQ